jgi:hypothetical protein
MKRYIYIIIGIIVVAAIAILVLFLIKNNSSGTSPSLNTTTTGSLPVAGTQNNPGAGSGTTPLSLPSSAATTTASAGGQMTVQNFGVLSSAPVADYFVNPQNNIIAIEPTGQVISITNGQSTTINTSTINNLISASFSYDGKRILVSYGDPTNPQAGIFNVSSSMWTSLPQGMLSPQWSPAKNYQIAYLVTTGNGKLALASINAANLKTSPTTLLTLNADDLTLQWPTQNEFILSDKPTSQSAGSIWGFDSQAGTLMPLVYETPGAEGIWSHNAAIPYGLVSFTTPANQNNTMQLEAFSGSLPTQPLTFQTLPTKCGFNTEQMPATSIVSTTTSTATTTSTKSKVISPITPQPISSLALYCGVPRSSSGFSSANLPDDYNTTALFTSDDIYKINTATGDVQSLWSDPTQNVDVSDLKFFNNAIFFINRYDQKLYGLTFAN